MKDFNADGSFATDSTFMTNADVPLLATAALIEHPVNPFTQNPLRSEKEHCVTITTSTESDPKNHFVNTFKIRQDEWLHVQDDIFELKNWE